MEKAKFFSYAGFHFKLCSLELRELFACVFNTDTFVKTVRKYLPNSQEFVPIYTCNRLDICIFGEVTKEQVLNLFYDLALEAVSSKFDQLPVCHKELRTHISDSLRFLPDIEGINLFFKVASSLDSLVLGETQILGQFKSAYNNAQERGYSSKKAALAFNHCLKAAKRIRTETELFKHVISIGHLAVECAQKEFQDITSKKVVVFGAGEMALLTAKHLTYHGVKNFYIANRTVQKAEWIAQKLKTGKALSLSHAMLKIDEFDICIVACGGDDLLIKYEDLLNKNLTKALLFIDISMPRKIDTRLSELKQVKIYNIDQLSAIVEKNKQARQNALEHAEKIIVEETEYFLNKQQNRENNKDFSEFNGWLSQVVQKEIDIFLEKKNKNQKLSSAVVARAVCKKVGSKMRKRMES